MTPLDGLENFYVIIGSSGGALIGLQFVVMALIANMPRPAAAQGDAGNAFATPNVVHFGTALLISGLLTAPWHDLNTITVLLSILGLCGVAYSLIVARRMRLQTLYRPVFEDWLCHAILPLGGYALLATSAYEARGVYAHGALFGVAAAVLLLLFVGIHNAWDAATYHVFVIRSKRHPSESSTEQTSSSESRSSH